ncbi:MAG: hypothetical protein MUE82_02845 [Chloroflexi bacterium]|nr:hypothetical protein [Chloroflexota bacterium]
MRARFAAAVVLVAALVVPVAMTAVALSLPPPADAAPVEGPAEAVPWTAPATEEGAEGPATAMPWTAAPPKAEIYASQVSVVPGERIDLHVSTPAKTYRIRVYREAATADGRRVELLRYRVDDRKGVDQRRRMTMDARSTPRANWTVTDTVRTTRAWKPGVYTILALDANDTRSSAIVVVRSPTIRPEAPLLVVPVLTYQAYNDWGGASSYLDARGVRSYRVSFDRPYVAGPGLWWSTRDSKLAGFVAGSTDDLQYTTDYDLSIAPPTTFPSFTVLARHTEYASKAMYDWLEEGVRVRGAMGLANFGANALYWQVRLEPATDGANRRTAPREIVIYRNDSVTEDRSPRDPIVGPTTTTRFRDAPVGRPEGLLLGAQFRAKLGSDSDDRWPMGVGPGVPWSLLEGTGWTPGSTYIWNLMAGEGDMPIPGPEGTVTMPILTSRAVSTTLEVVFPAATLRTFPSGGRVFNASTLGWPHLLPPAEFDPGVSDTSFGTFTRNILSWVDGDDGGPHGP